MPSYGLKKPVYIDYCATIVSASGSTQWVYIRESIGAKASFAKIAKHFDGVGKVTSFRHGDRLMAYDHAGIEQGNPGLVTNIWFGYGEVA